MAHPVCRSQYKHGLQMKRTFFKGHFAALMKLIQLNIKHLLCFTTRGQVSLSFLSPAWLFKSFCCNLPSDPHYF